MKSKARNVLFVVIISIMISTIAIGHGYTKTIEVVFNSVGVKVDNKYMSGDNIIYEGTTYVPIRAVTEVLGKDIEWDGKTRTANIVDKPLSSIEGSFKVPLDVPEKATLVESIPEYNYHKFNYIVDLPSGGRITQVSISKLPGDVPYVWTVGHDNEGVPFIRGRSNQDSNIRSISYYSNYWASEFTLEDFRIFSKEVYELFKAYGYSDPGYYDSLKYDW